MTKPAKFDDLKPTELYRSAIEDFALPVEEADKNKKTVLIAAFLEGGVSWADYVAQHPEVAPDEPVAPTNEVNGVPEHDVTTREPERDRGNVTTAPTRASNESLSVEGAVPVDPVPVAPAPPRVIVAEKPVAQPQDKFLIKMERQNPLFETRGYKFTQESPYALMSPEDADYVLTKEVGFRQAFPSEVAEFYG